MCCAIFLLEIPEPLARYICEMCQVTVYLSHLGLDVGHYLVGLVLVELEYALHLYLHEAEDIIPRHLTHQLRIEWCQAVVNMPACRLEVRSLLILAVLVYALLDEYLL